MSHFPTNGDRLNDLSKESIMMKVKTKELQGMEERFDRHLDESQELRLATFTVPRNEAQQRKYIETEGQNVSFRQIDESKLSTGLKLDKEVNQSHCDESKDSWLDINEVIESDFLISPGDIYPSRKVELKDAEVSEETLQRFEKLCEDQQDAFLKNNRDIGRTQLIEMEIDTGGSVPLAQSPYTLPLKHYDWVRKEIETLEKAGIIERSLSPWASPVIVVPKKSAPGEPPRRRLCVDYRRVNALQQEVKRTDKSTGCLTLYPLPKIDEMFSKLGGATILVRLIYEVLIITSD